MDDNYVVLPSRVYELGRVIISTVRKVRRGTTIPQCQGMDDN